MKSLLALVCTCVLFSCQTPKPQSACRVEEVKQLMAQQQQAWNEGDLPKFVSYYLESDSLKFIGRNGIVYGNKQLLENYQKSYPTDSARGKLQFDILHAGCEGSDFIHLTGKFTLLRAADTLSGHFTLHWRNTEQGWKIEYDHTS